MQTKNKRPDVRLEERLYTRLKEHCAARQISVAHYIRTFIINDLRAAGTLTPDDMRIMKGVD